MASLGNFDANDKTLSNCIPAGDYDLVVTKCDLKTTSNGEYQQTAMEFKVLNGEFQNRTLFAHYMFQLVKPDGANEKQKQAVQIGRGKFGAICKAVGVPKPASTEEIVGKVFTAKLKIRKSDDFGDQNEIAKASPRVASTGEPTKTGQSKW